MNGIQVYHEWWALLTQESTWWRHQMETFSALLALCAEKSPVARQFPSQRPRTRSFGVFFHLCLNKRLSKESCGWWFETQSHSLWRHCNRSDDRKESQTFTCLINDVKIFWFYSICTFEWLYICDTYVSPNRTGHRYMWFQPCYIHITDFLIYLRR